MSIPMARRGCEVVGLEIRSPSLRKAHFVSRAFNLSNTTWVQGDMLALETLGLGSFDLVLCFGTLYHVDAPHLLSFVRAIDRSCQGLAIFDTHVALTATETYQDASGLILSGRSIVEHPAGSTSLDKEQRLWASADNDFSFWPTERSLSNLLVAAGFGQVYRAMAPAPEWPWQDRHWWLAYSSSYTAARTIGTGPTESTRLADPDERPGECALLDAPGQRTATNPVTTKLSAS